MHTQVLRWCCYLKCWYLHVGSNNVSAGLIPDYHMLPAPSDLMTRVVFLGSMIGPLGLVDTNNKWTRRHVNW